MSFRELRNFIEMVKSMGYPRPVSMESFRTPNFKLVYDILYWLVQRYDPNVDIPDSIDTLQERIVFLKSIAQFVYYKGRIKLNIKKLYGADGYAVKEMLKLATVLYNASKIAQKEEEGDIETSQIRSSKFQDNVKTIRSYANELTESGAILFELLEKEVDLRKDRQLAISQPHNIDKIKLYLTYKNQETSEIIANLMESIESLNKDEENLKEKKKRKVSELERARKRLSRMQTFRPGYMNEYEVKEQELQSIYNTYVERHRNLEYLEHELDKFKQAEQEIIQHNKRKLDNLRKKIRNKELEILRGERMADLDDGEMSTKTDPAEEDDEDEEEDYDDGGNGSGEEEGEGEEVEEEEEEEEEDDEEDDQF